MATSTTEYAGSYTGAELEQRLSQGVYDDAVAKGFTGTKAEFDSFLAIISAISDAKNHLTNKSNPHSVTKSQVGLGNVTNESKATMFTNPAFTGTPTAPTPTYTTNSTQVATTAFVQTLIGKGFDASKIVSGTIDIARLPQGALERLVIVANDTARFALTTANVQKGDTVKVTSTGLMYYVKDDTKLNSADGYEPYTASTATSVPWSGVTSKPTTLSGYGITDAVSSNDSRLTNARPASDVHDWAKASTKPTYTASEVGALSASGTAVAASKVTSNLILKLNSGTTEGTNLYTFNGSAAKTLDIKAGTNVSFTTAAGVLTINNTYTYSLPTASSSTKGGILVGYTTSGKNYAVKVDSNGNAYVNVPWTDNNTTYTAGAGLLLSSGKFANTAPVYFIAGTQTAATNAWTGALPTGVTAYTNGLTINYYLPYAGTNSAATLNLGGLGAKNVYIGNGTSGVTTHFPAGSVIQLVYLSSLNNNAGGWKAIAYYNSNTTYAAGAGISLSGTTFSNSGVRSIVAGSSANQLSVNTGGTTTTITINNVANATAATKATQDSAGQQINTTYIKGLSVSGKVITYTKGDGTTGTITTQDTVYTLPTATSSALGGIKIGYSTSGKNYAVQLDSNGKAYVNVPWTDNNTTYSQATSSTLGLVKIGYSTSGKNYAVQLDSNGMMYVNVPWTDNNTTYAQATSSVLGLIKIGYSTSGKNYAVQLDSNGKAYVNVPWTDTDTNTTYSAGTGLSLSGTTFNHASSITAGTVGTSSATSGATLAVPYVTYNETGHITGVGTHTHTITGFAASSHNQASNTINALTGYSIGSSSAALAASDTLNAALAKLEYRLKAVENALNGVTTSVTNLESAAK